MVIIVEILSEMKLQSRPHRIAHGVHNDVENKNKLYFAVPICRFVDAVATTAGEVYENRKIHLKASRTHNFNTMSDACGGRYALAFDCSQPLRSELLLVADIVREQEVKEDKAINLVGAGLRWQMTPQSVLTAGVGVGFGQDSPDVRVTIGHWRRMK